MASHCSTNRRHPTEGCGNSKSADHSPSQIEQNYRPFLPNPTVQEDATVATREDSHTEMTKEQVFPRAHKVRTSSRNTQNWGPGPIVHSTTSVRHCGLDVSTSHAKSVIINDLRPYVANEE